MAMDMFMKINGVTGESADDKHKGEVDVLAWSWGMSNQGTAHMGAGSGAGKVSVNDLSFTKYIDFGSTALQLACCSGKHFADAVLTVRKAGENPLEYLKITANDVMVTSVSTGGSGGEDRLTEHVTLNFAKVKVEYQKQKATGGADGGPATIGWNIASNVKFG
jgi:type VI secretion system secreted protein Hcp